MDVTEVDNVQAQQPVEAVETVKTVIIPAKPKKVGQRKENYDDETTAELLKKTKPQIHTDWGGKDALDQISKKMAAKGISCGERSCEAILEIVKEQIDSIRQRINPRFDEAIRRIANTEVTYEETLD